MLKNKKLLLTIFAAILVLNPASVFALPSSSTDRSGNLCERKHNFSYNYNFSYPQKMEVGKTYDLQMAFFLSGSDVTRNAPKITVQIVASGFEVSETNVSLETKKTVQIKPLVEKPSLNIKTTLVLDGNTGQHRGYKATYKDSFDLNNFSITTAAAVQNTVPSATPSLPKENVPVVKSDTQAVIETVSTVGDEVNQNFEVQTKEPSKVSWYLVRALGILAYILLALSMAVAMLRKINLAKNSFLSRHHCDISYLAIIFTFLHLINNLWDKYEWNLGIKDLFGLDFSSRTRIMLSLGVIAFYLMFLLVATSISPKIMRFIKYKKWHFIHLFSYVLYIFVVIHAFFLGTDLDFANIGNSITLISLVVFWGLLLLNLFLGAVLIFKPKKNELDGNSAY